MKKLLFMMILGLSFAIPFSAGAFSGSGQGCSGNCTDCHTLDKKEAEQLIGKMAEKKMMPPSRVLDIKVAPAKGLWQIDVESGGKNGSIYLDFSKKYLIGQLIPVDMIGKLPEPPPAKINFSKLPLKEALVMGPKSADKKIVIFTDPDCPFCQKLHVEIKQVLARRHDVAFYIFLRPLPMHPASPKKAQAILCEKSIALLDDALAGKPVPEPSCSTTEPRIKKNNELADSLGLRSTPTLVRSDGAVNAGYLPADQLSDWIDGKTPKPAK